MIKQINKGPLHGAKAPFSVLIPARLESARLPRKLLAEVAGQPAFFHTWRAACASGAERVLIAAGSEEIADAACAFGADVCLTDAALPSGTDRCLAAAEQGGFSTDSVLVNLQADELMMPPQNMAELAQLLITSGGDIATLAQPLAAAEARRPERVKVVRAEDGRALYFSRALIPWNATQGAGTVTPLHHLGIYAYRFKTLRQFAALAPSPLEQLEKLEQLRALEAGMHIAVGMAAQPVPPGLDTEDDLQRLRAAFAAEKT